MSRLLGRVQILVMSLAIAVVILAGCDDDHRPGAVDKFEIARAHMASWLSEAGADLPIKSSSFLKETVVDDWQQQQEHYQIISVRSAVDYAGAGHIPNAINIFWRDIASDESLSRLSPTKTLVAYCYTGHAGMLSTTILGLMGFDALNLTYGMMDWNLEALNMEPWDMEADYPVETTVRSSERRYSTPALTSDYDDPEDIVRELAASYITLAAPFVSSASVKAIVDDWDNQKSEYQIISVRAGSEYEAGHVPEAINIPWQTIADLENLKKIDPNKTAIIYCSTGHTGQIASTVLSLLGYDATNMAFGMMDWNKAHVDESTQWDGEADYPVESGEQ